MKKLLQLLAIIFLFTAVNYAQLLEENFDYGTEDNDDIISVAPWIRHSGAVGPKYEADGLSYEGYAGSNIGGSIWFTRGSSGNNDGDVHRRMEDSLASDGSFYVSFLLNLDSARTTADYFFHLGARTIGTNFRSRVFAIEKDGGFNLGLSKSSETAVYSNTVLQYGVTYLAVVKYTYSSASTTDDLVTLYVYSSGIPAAEPGSPTVQIGPLGAGASGDISVGSIAIRQGTNTATGRIDGFRIASTWNEAPVPVELTSFTAAAEKGAITLKWSTATETNNRGFQIERKAAGENWKKLAFVDGKGNSTSPVSYRYSDKQAVSGKYSYRLKQIDLDGTATYSNVVEVEAAPLSFELGQNYPNPFNPSTTIKFQMPQSGNVTLKVYNLLGQEVKTLINGFREAGVHTVNFNADGLNSGLYLYKIETAGFNQVKKMTLVK